MLKFSISTGRGFFLINVKVLHMHVAPGSWKRERDPLELESQMVVSHHVSAGDQMRIL